MKGCTIIYPLVVTLNESIKYLHFLHVLRISWRPANDHKPDSSGNETYPFFAGRLQNLWCTTLSCPEPSGSLVSGQWPGTIYSINTHLRWFNGYRCRWPPSCMWLLRRFSLRLLGLLLLLHQCGWWRIKCTSPLHGHTIHLGTKIRHCQYMQNSTK